MYKLKNFIIFSIFGFIMESTIYKVNLVNRHSGILYGPYTLVYGFGILMLLILYNYIKNKKINKYLKPFLYYVSFVFFLTLIEYLGGNILNFLFNVDMWDYTAHKFHFGKYIALDISLIWGILGLVYIYFIKIFSDKICNIMTKKGTYVFLYIILIDSIITLIIK